MDNGEEIPALNEDWNFLGAKVMEWASGLVSFLLVSEVFFHGRIGQGVPFALMAWVGTTVSMASVRKQFPDEERGVRNLVCLSLGVPPPGIPTPADLQEYWSGAPLRQLSTAREWEKLGLTEALAAELPEELNPQTGEGEKEEE